jgi:L-lactate dehydrogenase
MIMSGVGSEIVLVDLNAERAQAEADDLLHAVPFAQPMVVRSGDYAALHESQVVVVAAGVNQKPGESRLQLLGRNAQVFSQVVPNILQHAPEALILVATNPVDIMTHLAAHFTRQAGVPANRVIGSGTSLDTARFRAMLGRRLGVDSQHVHAYVLGEHGDSEVLTWSLASIGGIPLEDFCRLRNLEVCDKDKDEIEHRVRHAAYNIIAGKGATYYGVGSAIARIAESVLRDQRSIFTVCSPIQEVAGVANVTLSLPHLLGGDGILQTLQPRLNEAELGALQKSATLLRDLIDKLEQEIST